MSLISERNERIKQGITFNLIDYITELRKQRELNPDKAKLTLLPFTPPEIYIGKVITRIIAEAYEYTGIVRLDRDLYQKGTVGQSSFLNNENLFNDFFAVSEGEDDFSNVEKSKLYYEFIKTNTKREPSFKDWHYAYVPVTKGSYKALKSKLPSIKKWEVDKPVSSLLPERLNLIPTSGLPNTERLEEPTTKDLTHPFLPFMVFTGVVSQVNREIEAYEYFDSKGYYGLPDATYYSFLRPLELNYPLGNPDDYQLYTDTSWQACISLAPTWDMYNSIPENYSFTGFITTGAYSPYKTFYLYYKQIKTSIAGIEIATDVLYLHECRPHSKGRNYLTSVIAAKDASTINVGVETSQGLVIRQISLTTPLVINDLTPLHTNINIMGDTTILNDKYAVNPLTGSEPDSYHLDNSTEVDNNFIAAN